MQYRFDHKERKQEAEEQKKKKSRAIRMRKKTKSLQNTGHAYRTFKEAPERKMHPACRPICRLKYFSKFSKEERVYVFKRYWSLGNINALRSLSLVV
jgi:hypothetical protein